MASEKDIMFAMQDAVRQALCEAANDEIKKLRERFEREMVTKKREMVCKIVNEIQIVATHNLNRGEYVIQIRLNGGKDND